MAGTCKRPGCEGKLQARGLCNNHYAQWHRRLAVKPGMSDSKKECLAAMPGTYQQIADRCGLKYETVRKCVSKMYAAGEVHIEDQLPPANTGHAYLSVFAAGPGEDRIVSKSEKRSNSLAARRRWYLANLSRPRANGNPLAVAMYGIVKPQQQNRD